MTVTKTNLESISIHMFPDGRLNVENAATYLGLEQKTLAMMRSTGRGPKFIKRGRIFYYKEDLDAWLNAAARCSSTTQAMLHRKQFEMTLEKKTIEKDERDGEEVDENVNVGNEKLINLNCKEGNNESSK